jgi:hypothetical protein
MYIVVLSNYQIKAACTPSFGTNFFDYIEPISNGKKENQKKSFNHFRLIRIGLFGAFKI